MVAALSSETVQRRLREGGVTIVDLRSAPAFSRGHPAGSLCIPYSERHLADRILVAEPGTTAVVLVVDGPGLPRGALEQLEGAGLEVVGHGPGDPDRWADAGVGWQDLPERPLDALAESRDTVVVDVREPMEWTTGHAPGAVLIPLGEVCTRIDALPRDREIVLICESGIRSATAASILQKAGYANVSHAPLGTAGIRQTGGDLEFPSAD